ncbi:MAG: UvrD-helicase domain-containing protein, partial [Acidimicrobiales bacterium]|nr:UvrD-helicase domain-containing protein [Acidimicrobiales bacterium]
KKENWGGDAKPYRDKISAANEAMEAFQNRAMEQVLRRLAIEVARFTIQSARERAAEGRLEFHDLLVLARQLLRDHPRARAELRNRYALLLLDEFQDTDPIQIELAVLLASSMGDPDDAGEIADDPAARPWHDVPVDPGCLFVVGDPKQSIYRFRRADLNLFLEARRSLAEDDPVALVQNFRTVPSILSWVNKVFGKIIGADDSVDGAPAIPIDYVALEAFREDGPRIDHRPVILGGVHPDPKVRADELRMVEAGTVALAIAEIRAEPGKWQVYDEDDEQWRNPRLSDIAILIPTRASLRFLQQALDEVDVPSRADTGVLLYDQPEIRSVLAVLTAIVDPADQIAVVAALRSPLFACGDDDLYRWKSAHGSWDYRQAGPDVLGPDHVVARAMGSLQAWHGERWWLEPSELINRIYEERKAFALAFADSRPRDAWRRLRYLLDQARAFQEAKGGDLRDFLAWAALQGADGARAHEPTLPEADDDAVRIMTIHGAKGLEFPITVVSGLTTVHRSRSQGVQVLWPDDGGEPRFKSGSRAGSTQFEELADLEGAMNADEKNRLLYVACTRARDHLLVSGFHKEGSESHGQRISALSQDLLGAVARSYEAPVMIPPGPPVQLAMPDTGDTVEARADFIADRESLLRDQSVVRSLSATAIARQAQGAADGEEGDGEETGAKAATDYSLEPGDGQTVWRRGRAGTAIGRAVHGVLQALSFADPGRCEALARAQAHAESVPWAADQIAATVRQALTSPILQAAVHAPRSFKELFVSMPLGDVVVEGYVDLLVESEQGLIVVDYKTDAVASEAEVDAKMAHYRLQGATYALAVAQTTGRPVIDCVFVFAGPNQVFERRVTDLDDAMAQVRSIAEASGASVSV